MARKITTEAIKAFMSAKPFNKDNTSVSIEEVKAFTFKEEMVVLRLHGNTIAQRLVDSNEIEVTSAGWFSTTTKERLNGIPGVSVCQKKGIWFLNGEKWDGSWTTI
ncbi:hypothetical protein 16Q_145 [Pseudomonas phage 16Q]|nr:hypothetical protein 16Q_145 [Pseudomonas phage 16Q]